jgi:hypothetical protein
LASGNYFEKANWKGETERKTVCERKVISIMHCNWHLMFQISKNKQIYKVEFFFAPIDCGANEKRKKGKKLEIDLDIE